MCWQDGWRLCGDLWGGVLVVGMFVFGDEERRVWVCGCLCVWEWGRVYGCVWGCL